MTATPVEEILEIGSWEDVRFVLRSRSFDQVAPEDGYAEGTELQYRIIGDSLVMARGEPHFERRRIESTLFRLPTLLMYEHELVEPRLHARLDGLPVGPDGRPVGDVVEIGQDALLAVMAKLLGIDVSTPEREEHFRDIFTRLDSGSRVRHMIDMHQVLDEGLEVQREFNETFWQPAWEAHEHALADVAAGRLDEAALPNDLVTVMLRNRDHFAQWDDGVYLREATLYTAASVGTTTRELALCVEALEEWLLAHPEEEPRRTDTPFLAAAFAESCRLHQSVQDVGRTAMEDVTLPSGTVVRAGRPVRVSLVGANRDLLGPTADQFDPHRAVPPEGDSTGLAFSDGRHTCIGKLLVLGEGRAAGSDSGRLGTAVTILRELYAAGMRRDPYRAPTLKATTTKRYATYPVVFAPR